MPLAAGIPESLALCLTAVTVGAVHTLLGPDHYVPFVATSRAGCGPAETTARDEAVASRGARRLIARSSRRRFS
jgi:hypothetical protein